MGWRDGWRLLFAVVAVLSSTGIGRADWLYDRQQDAFTGVTQFTMTSGLSAGSLMMNCAPGQPMMLLVTDEVSSSKFPLGEGFAEIAMRIDGGDPIVIKSKFSVTRPDQAESPLVMVALRDVDLGPVLHALGSATRDVLFGLRIEDPDYTWSRTVDAGNVAELVRQLLDDCDVTVQGTDATATNADAAPLADKTPYAGLSCPFQIARTVRSSGSTRTVATGTYTVNEGGNLKMSGSWLTNEAVADGGFDTARLRFDKDRQLWGQLDVFPLFADPPQEPPMFPVSFGPSKPFAEGTPEGVAVFDTDSGKLRLIFTSFGCNP